MDNLKSLGDTLSLSVVFTTLAGWLPSIAALVSIIWGAIRIYETKTVQSFLGKRRGRGKGGRT